MVLHHCNSKGQTHKYLIEFILRSILSFTNLQLRMVNNAMIATINCGYASSTKNTQYSTFENLQNYFQQRMTIP